MKIMMKRIITTILIFFLILFSYLLILNINISKLVTEENINKTLYDVSVVQIINSDKLKDNQYIKETKDTLDKLYTIATILNISEDKIDEIIDSKITKDILTKVITNIIDSVIFNKDTKLFNISDYNEIVDDNIDIVIKEINLDLDNSQKEILVNVLKEIGKKLVNEIPSTSKITDKLNFVEITSIRLLISTSVKNILMILNLFLIILLIIISNKELLKQIGKYLFSLVLLLSITCIVISLFSLTFTDEWLFIRKFILNYVNRLLISVLFLIFISIIFNIIKRKA